MGLYGNLNTMSVAELLAWVEGGRKTGTLEVERDKIVKRITFASGRVASCSSNDPTTLMGQFLLSSGKITGEMLSQALSRQGNRTANLGQILLEMGAITQADREAFVGAKVEETIYGLFDWDDAVFRFYTDAAPDPNAVDASLSIDEVLKRGRKRSAERRVSVQAINDPRIVLRRTGEPPPAELATSRSARRVFDLIDGKKTVSEIVLHSHASEFLVAKFLTALLQGKVVEVAEVRPEPIRPVEIPPLAVEAPLPAAVIEIAAPAPVPAPLSPAAAPAPLAASPPSVTPPPVAPPSVAVPVAEPAAAPPAAAAAPARADRTPRKRGYRLLPRQADEVSRELQSEINVALQLMATGQPEAALELLNAMAAAHPADTALRQLVVNAEQDFCKKMLEGELAAGGVAVRSGLVVPEQLSAEESFLLEHLDGRTDIQALLWIAPMRDIDALKILHRMLKRGWLELRRAA